ncbi:MAG: serine hydrolase [Proteobacteria bacterium]|nr:serine hydrolase [Pseudomonadota bacterium]
MDRNSTRTARLKQVPKVIEDAPSAWKAITVEQTLTHTAGFPAWRPKDTATGYEPYVAKPDLDVR